MWCLDELLKDEHALKVIISNRPRHPDTCLSKTNKPRGSQGGFRFPKQTGLTHLRAFESRYCPACWLGYRRLEEVWVTESSCDPLRPLDYTKSLFLQSFFQLKSFVTDEHYQLKKLTTVSFLVITDWLSRQNLFSIRDTGRHRERHGDRQAVPVPRGVWVAVRATLRRQSSLRRGEVCWLSLLSSLFARDKFKLKKHSKSYTSTVEQWKIPLDTLHN